MSEPIHIPMFPLAILPLPGELVPLHIFEPRYKQLLQDVETNDVRFGIYFNHTVNEEKIGSLMRLESVIKRYPSGESDIIVKCEDIFSLVLMLRNFSGKMYPAGDVRRWDADILQRPSSLLHHEFVEYLKQRNLHPPETNFTIHQIAQDLGLDVHDRYKFLRQPDVKKDGFLLNHVRYQIDLIKREDKSKDVFHLN